MNTKVKLSSKIELHITSSSISSDSSECAPFCEYTPKESRSSFMPEIEFLEGTCTTAAIVSTSRYYMTAEGGYPEMYPGEDLD